MCSCCKEEKWTGDYYSYHLGVIIDGTEYHETSPWLDLYQRGKEYGFLLLNATNTDNTDYSCFYSLWDTRRFGAKPGSDGYDDGFSLDISAAIKSSSFFSGDVYHFNCTVYSDCWVINDPRNYQGESLVYGMIGWHSHFYLAKKGWIVFGEYDEDGHNKDRVSFEFTAFDDAGDSLVVKNGYCNIYSGWR